MTVLLPLGLFVQILDGDPIAVGLLRQVRSYRTDFYQHHEITSAGRKALRNDRQEQGQ